MRCFFHIMTVLSLGAILVSCAAKEDNDSPPSESGYGVVVDIPHYITSFLTDISSATVARKASADEGALVLGVYISPFEAFSYNEYDEQSVATYESMCARYGDAGYDRVRIDPRGGDVHCIDGFCIKVEGCYCDGQKIELIDISESCYFCTTTPLPYIASGYTETYDWTQRPDVFFDYDAEEMNRYYSEYHPLSIPLKEWASYEPDAINTMNGYTGYIVIPDFAAVNQDYDFVCVSVRSSSMEHWIGMDCPLKE